MSRSPGIGESPHRLANPLDTIGERVRDALQRRGQKQGDLAAHLSITPGSLCNALNRNNPTWAKWPIVAEWLGVSLRYLLTGNQANPWETSAVDNDASQDPVRRGGDAQAGSLHLQMSIPVAGYATADGLWKPNTQNAAVAIPSHWEVVSLPAARGLARQALGTQLVVDSQRIPKPNDIVIVRTRSDQVHVVRFHTTHEGVIFCAGLDGGRNSLILRSSDIEKVYVVVASLEL